VTSILAKIAPGSQDNSLQARIAALSSETLSPLIRPHDEALSVAMRVSRPRELFTFRRLPWAPFQLFGPE
jgi:hypothetical protein